MISLRRVHIIAERDFWAIVKTRSFVYGLLTFVFVGAILPIVMAVGNLKTSYRIAVLDLVGDYVPLLNKKAEKDGRFTFINFPTSEKTIDRDRAALLARLRQYEFTAVLEVKYSADKMDDEFVFNAASMSDPIPNQKMGEFLPYVVCENRAKRLGVSKEKFDKIYTPIKFDIMRRSGAQEMEKAEDTDFAMAFIVPIILVFTMYGLISFQSERLLTALMEEKLKRLVEVLLTRVTVFELLLGKMLGILRVGLLIYTGAGFLGYIIAQFAGFAHILSAQNILFYTLFFVAGYGLYAAFYLSIGSACANPKDAENLAMPVRFVLMTPVIASVYVNLHPTAPLAGFFAYFPLTAPFVMTNRMLVTEIPIWSLCGSLVLVVVCAGAGLWVAARILQASIGAHGRALSLREIWQSITSSSARRITPDAA